MYDLPHGIVRACAGVVEALDVLPDRYKQAVARAEESVGQSFDNDAAAARRALIAAVKLSISHLAPLCVCMDGEFSPFADNGFGLIFRIKFSRDCRVGDDLKICHASHPPCILCGRYGKIQTRATAFVWVCLWVSS